MLSVAHCEYFIDISIYRLGVPDCLDAAVVLPCIIIRRRIDLCLLGEHKHLFRMNVKTNVI